MKWTRAVLALAVLIAAALFLIPLPSVMWDGHKSFTLSLTGQSLAETETISYRAVANEREGRVQCEFYQNEKMTDLNDLFRPTVLTAEGRFTVEVPAFGSIQCWGLWRERGMYENVIVAATLKNGDRVFKCVSVNSNNPIELR